MTEESYQQCRKVMRQINHLRGLITMAEVQVAKWTHMEGAYRKELKQAQADGANKCLEKAIKRLGELRAKFDLIKFPESNIVIAKTKSVQCEGCGAAIADGNTYCGECLVED